MSAGGETGAVAGGLGAVAGESGAVAGDLPARSRGVIGLLEENCTVCMLCARECPDWCIYIDSHKEPVPGGPVAGGPGPAVGEVRAGAGPARAPAGRGRQRVRNALDRFAIDFSLCMYCGICVEVCPYDALFWAPEFSYAETDIRDLTHERGRLREWMWHVPPPPPHDPGAAPPRESLVTGSGQARAPGPGA
ncbi:MAG TPA: 4Fe-4S binding protein [Streptosporangiaceae bacterium]|nr:4Fe-4S binding protein [Streptosporangiaceae bacterium]